ncbi:LOG family protein [Streptomyces nodosus]|uniref:DNA-processing protein DprA n=1 Tax=Streptomyces nodosus TaxID=40318 RepID=UPI000AF65E80|nr:DNA-processing protein DprA [Streptomyces nodosus]MBB4794944.1 putative Rossmann fold nucleotide-binding protein DprA/Smf involved in DNA uptake [Streptomyces nodosus]
MTITGTRSTEHRPLTEYADLFTRFLSPFAPSAHFYIGGAKGIDSLSLLWLADNTNSGLTIVAPGTVDQQPAEARQAITRARDRITEIVELKAPELNAASYHARNRWMVDHTSMTIGFPCHGRLRSGTWQTLEYTLEQGKPHVVVPI